MILTMTLMGAIPSVNLPSTIFARAILVKKVTADTPFVGMDDEISLRTVTMAQTMVSDVSEAVNPELNRTSSVVSDLRTITMSVRSVEMEFYRKTS